MRLLTTFLLFFSLALPALAQQKPDYDRSRTPQVLSDRASRSREFLAIPGGASYTVPTYVADSTKKYGIYYLISAGDTALMIGGKRIAANYAALVTKVNQKADAALINAPNGIAGLDGSGKVPLSQINDALLGAVNYQGNYNATTNTPALPAAAASNKGYYWVVSAPGTRFGLPLKNGDWIISNGSVYQQVDNNNILTSVNGKVGAAVLTTTDIAEGTNLYYTDSRVQTTGDARYARLGSNNTITGSQLYNFGPTDQMYIGPSPGSGSGSIVEALNSQATFKGYKGEYYNLHGTNGELNLNSLSFLGQTKASKSFSISTDIVSNAPNTTLRFGYDLTQTDVYDNLVYTASDRTLRWKGAPIVTSGDLTGLYTNGLGILLSGNAFSLDKSYTDGLYRPLSYSPTKAEIDAANGFAASRVIITNASGQSTTSAGLTYVSATGTFTASASGGSQIPLNGINTGGAIGGAVIGNSTVANIVAGLRVGNQSRANTRLTGLNFFFGTTANANSGYVAMRLADTLSNGTADMLIGVSNAGTVSDALIISGATKQSNFYGAVKTGGTGIATGKYILGGSSGGEVTLTVQNNAGTYNFNLPTSAGSSGQYLTSQGGGSTAMTWTTLLIKPQSYTVATLPTGQSGLLAFVTDALSPTYLGVVTGGGSGKALVMYDGTNWIVH